MAHRAVEATLGLVMTRQRWCVHVVRRHRQVTMTQILTQTQFAKRPTLSLGKRAAVLLDVVAGDRGDEVDEMRTVPHAHLGQHELEVPVERLAAHLAARRAHQIGILGRDTRLDSQRDRAGLVGLAPTDHPAGLVGHRDRGLRHDRVRARMQLQPQVGLARARRSGRRSGGRGRLSRSVHHVSDGQSSGRRQ